MASLAGVVDEWDSSADLRERMREKRRLFLPEEGKETLSATVACCSMNFEVLKPLAQRLQNPPGTVGMFTVPDLLKENLTCNKSDFFVFHHQPTIIGALGQKINKRLDVVGTLLGCLLRS